MTKDQGQLEQNIQDTASQLGAINKASANLAAKEAQEFETKEASGEDNLDAATAEGDVLNNAVASDSEKAAPKERR